METKSLHNVRIKASCRVSCYAKTKGVRTRPTRCVEILDSVEGLKDHYRLKGTSYLWKGETLDLELKMKDVEGYGIRVSEWRYI
jgi:hypothetical protein